VQFRLKSLFTLIFMIACACGVLLALPDWICCIVLAVVALVSPAAIVAGIVYGRGARRAFFIGCLASCGWMLWAAPYFIVQLLAEGVDGVMSVEAEAAIWIKTVFVAFYAVLALSGLVSVAVRRLSYQGRNHIRPPRDCC
jgi:hypothetical protein